MTMIEQASAPGPARPLPSQLPCNPGARLLAALAVLALVCGCHRAPKAIPASPPEVVKVVVKGMQNNEPEVLWNAMPAGYQSDLRGLIATFCDHMDAETYNRGFRILNKAVRVLKEKQDYIFKSPVALSTPLENMMGPRWNESVELLNMIATSELASLDSLRAMDPGKFLSTTGQNLMERMEHLRQQSVRNAGPNPWDSVGKALEAARIEFQPSGDDRGWLRFHSTTNAMLRDTELVRVEGRWVPVMMASAWKERIEQAKVNLAKLSGPEYQKVKPMVGLVMGTLETAMDTLLKAGSQKEFDDTLKGLAAVGSLVSSMRNKPQ